MSQFKQEQSVAQHENSSHRVVISGIGIVSPYGIGVERFWQGLKANESALRITQRFLHNGTGAALCAEVMNFTPGTEDARFERLPLVSQYAVIAAEEALRISGVKADAAYPERTGVYYGSCYGPGEASVSFNLDLMEKGPSSVKPLLFQETVFNAPSALISIRNNIKGPHLALASGSTSGAQAIEMAFYALLSGEVDYALVGASDVFTSMLYDTFSRLGYLADSPSSGGSALARDTKKNNMVLGEGAGFIVLETQQNAHQRGARVFGEITGVALSHDAYAPFGNDPKGRVLAQTLADALDMSGTAPQAIDMVLLAANNTSPLDSAEEKALQQVFMHHYATLKKRTTKHLIGETAAAGIFMNLAAAILEMDLLHATAAPVHGRKPDCHALCHSCHYSGSNAAVVLRKTCGAAPAAYIAASDSDLL